MRPQKENCIQTQHPYLKYDNEEVEETDDTMDSSSV